jgi:muconolactone delta-isomerase
MGKVGNLEEILPKEFAKVGEWKESGILAHLFVKEAASGAVLIFNGTDVEKVRQLISELPLFSHFEKIDYILLDKQF